MAGKDKNNGGASDLHSDENWHARLEQARVRRAKAMREKQRLSKAAGGAQKAPKPWEQEAAQARPIAPIIQERDLDGDAYDFADRMEAIRQTAQTAPTPDNDDPAIDAEAQALANAEAAAATLAPVPAEDVPAEDVADDLPDPSELLVLSKSYAAALDAFEKGDGASEAEPDVQADTAPEIPRVDPNTADRFAAALASIEHHVTPDADAADVVVDLSDHYGAHAPSAPQANIYPGADPELAKRYATALAALSKAQQNAKQSKSRRDAHPGVAAGGRRVFMLSSLVLVVGLLSLPWIPAQPLEFGPKVTPAPNPGLQPALGVSQSLQDTFAIAVPLIPRVAPAAPGLPDASVPAPAADVVPTPAGLSVPQVLDAPELAGWNNVAPVAAASDLAGLHDPLIADHTFVAGLSPDVTAPADAVTRPSQLTEKLPEFRNIRTEVRPLQLDGTDFTPISGTITVTALDTESPTDALAAAIAADVARSLRR